MMSTPPAVPAGKSFDLYLGFGGKRLVWTNPDHGVTLSDDGIAWFAAGRDWHARLRDIDEVHLQTGNVGENTLATCRLRFSDGTTLTILSSTASGLQDAKQDELYAAFVHDLHGRLAALTDACVAFTAGFSDTRYRFGKVVIVVATLFFLVTPTVLLLMTGEWKMGWALYAGVALVWPVYRLMRANAPRGYDPRQVPREMLP
jgi:hypothetical protein